MVSQNSPAALQRQMQNIRGNLSEHADEAVKKARQGTRLAALCRQASVDPLGRRPRWDSFWFRAACFQAGNSEAVTEAVDRVARAVQPSPLAGIVAGVLSAVTTTIARRGHGLGYSSVKQCWHPRGESSAKEPAGRSE